MLNIFPPDDITGIVHVRFSESFSKLKLSDSALGCYIGGDNDKNAAIEINIPNLISSKAPEYLFQDYFEIAALILSGVISHEIGHHVHTFKRHGIKKRSIEDFADRYSEAGYYKYLKSRSSLILSSYRRASYNFLRFNKEGRKSFAANRKELLAWLQKSEEPEFP